MSAECWAYFYIFFAGVWVGRIIEIAKQKYRERHKVDKLELKDG